MAPRTPASNRLVFVVATLLVAIAASGCMSASPGASAGASAPGSTTSAAPASKGAATDFPVAGEWSDPIELRGDRGSTVSDIAAGASGTVVAVGSTDLVPYGDVVPPFHARVWTTRDGVTWDPVPPQASLDAGRMDGVTAFEGGFVAVGSQNTGGEAETGQSITRAVVWRSPDGVTWEAVQGSPTFEGSGMRGVVATPTGLLAVGCSAGALGVCRDEAIWESPDGRAWELVAHSVNSSEVDFGWLGDVAVVRDVRVAVGTRMLLSVAGGEWRLAELAGDIPSLAGMTSVVSTGTDFLAVGWVRDDGGSPHVWLLRSDDGAAWRRGSRLVPEPDFAQAYDAVLTPEGLVVVGSRSIEGSGAPMILFSPDFATFVPDLDPAARVPGGALSAVASTPVGLLAGGTEDRMPAIWLRR